MHTPKLRFHKGTKRYLVTIEGHDIYLGKDPQAAQHEYLRILLERNTNAGTPPTPTPTNIHICELVEKYDAHMQTYYRSNPKSWERGKNAMRVLVRFHGHCKPDEFRVSDLRLIREHFVKNLCRKEINKHMREIARLFRWGASMELCSPDIYGRILSLEPLKAGRSEARETKPVQPVPLAHVEAVKPHVTESVRALIDLQLLTGARPGELIALRAEDIERAEEVWMVRLQHHKTAHRGKTRVLFLGPKAQAVLKPLLLRRGANEYLFQPSDAIRERSERSTCHRRPDQAPSEKKTSRVVRDCYDMASYRRAISRACAKAGVPPWHPHQLRHTAGTFLRAQYGIEVARAVLGHAHLSATEIYAEADQTIARNAIAQVG